MRQYYEVIGIFRVSWNLVVRIVYCPVIRVS